MRAFLGLAVFVFGALWLMGPEPEQKAAAVCERHGMTLYTNKPTVVCRNDTTGEEIPLAQLD